MLLSIEAQFYALNKISSETMSTARMSSYSIVMESFTDTCMWSLADMSTSIVSRPSYCSIAVGKIRLGTRIVQPFTDTCSYS